MLGTERGRTRLHSVENWFWKRLWTCRKAGNRVNGQVIHLTATSAPFFSIPWHLATLLPYLYERSKFCAAVIEKNCPHCMEPEDHYRGYKNSPLVPHHPIPSRSILISSPSTLMSSKWLLSFTISHLNRVTHPPRFDPRNIWRQEQMKFLVT